MERVKVQSSNIKSARYDENSINWKFMENILHIHRIGKLCSMAQTFPTAISHSLMTN